MNFKDKIIKQHYIQFYGILRTRVSCQTTKKCTRHKSQIISTEAYNQYSQSRNPQKRIATRKSSEKRDVSAKGPKRALKKGYSKSHQGLGHTLSRMDWISEVSNKQMWTNLDQDTVLDRTRLTLFYFSLNNFIVFFLLTTNHWDSKSFLDTFQL